MPYSVQLVPNGSQLHVIYLCMSSTHEYTCVIGLSWHIELVL